MFRIREATSADNEALLRLETMSPQGTGISILIDRDDYFYRSRLHDRSKVLIAEEDGELVGIMAFAIKEVLLDGGPERVAYFYDLRGEVSYRRSMKRGLFRLWKACLAEIEEEGAAFIYGHIKSDNNDSMRIVTKMDAKIGATFSILSLPGLPGDSGDLDDHLEDLEREIARLDRHVGIRSLRPCDFGAAYRRGAELGYLRGIFRIEKGDSAAQVSAWDLSKIYRGRVLRMPASLLALGVFLNPLATFLPVPRIPKVGEQLTYLQLFDPICEGKAGGALLKTLIQRLRPKALADGIDILTLFVYQDDPLLPHMPRFYPQKVMYYHTVVRPCRSNELPARPLYLDIRDI